jgi:hypothetical protein
MSNIELITARLLVRSLSEEKKKVLQERLLKKAKEGDSLEDLNSREKLSLTAFTTRDDVDDGATEESLGTALQIVVPLLTEEEKDRLSRSLEVDVREI